MEARKMKLLYVVLAFVLAFSASFVVAQAEEAHGELVVTVTIPERQCSTKNPDKQNCYSVEATIDTSVVKTPTPAAVAELCNPEEGDPPIIMPADPATLVVRVTCEY